MSANATNRVTITHDQLLSHIQKYQPIKYNTIYSDYPRIHHTEINSMLSYLQATGLITCAAEGFKLLPVAERGMTSGKAEYINDVFNSITVKASLKEESVAATLEARAQTYGDFTENATISQEIKNILRKQPNWLSLSRPHKESLEMIAQKIARILNGDPEYKDNWHDIAGYAQLAEARCKSSEGGE